MTAQPLSSDRLVTGEAVELEVRAARAGSRVTALLVDLIVIAALALVLGSFGSLALSSLPIDLNAASMRGITVVATVVLLVGYPVTWETLYRGRTPGKAALGLRVVRDDGGPVRLRHALTRSLVGVATEWPGVLLPPITWVAALTTMLSNPRGKRLGDLVAGTMVIHERTPASWGWVPGMPPALAGWARTLDLTGVSDDLALAVRHFLARARELREPARTELGRALAAEVAAVSTPPPPPNVPGWAYLAAVLAERHRRARERLGRARAVSAAIWPDLVPRQYEPPAALPAPPPPRPELPSNPMLRPGTPSNADTPPLGWPTTAQGPRPF
ncbi:RDD family protein [Asanoa siamensis]|uniref:RDD family protein n=1 Tax=Asanoa siamensis TaxID=926357 RepID=UPI001EF1FFC7|nr:RDD family protein [Asanoa siamensis]